MTTSKKTSTLLLSPRDGLFLKDGRGWTTSAAGRAHTLPWPLPSTVRGALRHAFGLKLQEAQQRTFAREEWPGETAHLHLSAMVAVRRPHGAPSWSREDIMWPRPADLVPFKHEGEDEARFVPLRPTPPDTAHIGALGLDDEPLTQAILRLHHPALDLDGKPEAGVSPWLTHGEFVGWLLDETPPITPTHKRALASRDTIHVGIAPATQTADPGRLYSTTTLETLERDAEWAIAARVQHRDKLIKDWPDAVPVGGKQRLATLDAYDKHEQWKAPDALINKLVDKKYLRLVLATPARFAQGWLPDGLALDERGDISGTLALHRYDKRPIALPRVRLIAACVGRPLGASGWDMARGAPKRGVRLVPAGSVYFFELLDDKKLSKELAGALWLAQLGAPLPDDHADQDGFRTQDGFGCVVPGIWNP